MKKTQSCPVCFSKNVKKIFKAQNQHGNEILNTNVNFDYLKCKNCRAVFLNNIIIDKSYYKSYYSFPVKINSSRIQREISHFFDIQSVNSKKKIITQSRNPKNRRINLLDIGCGTGNFLISLDRSKYNAIGIEKDKGEFLICKQKNLNVLCADILRHNFGNKKFDVITMWHVVEHIQDPHKLLKQISKILKKDGILIMTTPNNDSIGFKLAHEKWFHLDAPRHLILYGYRAMNKLSLDNGFRVKKVYSQVFEFPLDLFWSINHLQMKYFIYLTYPFVKYFSRETLTYIITKTDEV